MRQVYRTASAAPRRRASARSAGLGFGCVSALALGAAEAPRAAAADVQAPGPSVSEVVVTASRLDLLGKADTASQGSVTRKEVELRPIYRPGQLLETVPGLVVTIHSGEGKANQYLLRGFNLDHGTDFASFIDDMPINRPSNTHGQGYSDQNFVMPQLISGLDYTKGPYYATIGDFGAVGSAHMHFLDVIPNTVSLSAGTLGDQDAFLGSTHAFTNGGHLLAAAEYAHLDGPWTQPNNFHKINLALRYSHGTDADGYSLTALYHHSHGNLTTDQPQRAVEEGLIDRFGTLDPSDGSRSERLSFSGRVAKSGDQWAFAASAYYIRSRQTLWNDFTHYLDDPVNGDQEEQVESRNADGGQAALTLIHDFGATRTVTVGGLQVRDDDVYVSRLHTLRRAPLPYCDASEADGAPGAGGSGGLCNGDRVNALDVGPYLQTTIYWTPWLRTILGAREEYYRATDHSVTTGFRGTTDETLFQPKGSLVIGPFHKTEVYVSAGRGFHSDDVRGVFGTVPEEGAPGSAGTTPLLAKTTGEEVGLRTNIVPKVQVQAVLFQEDFDSELAYDADAGADSASAPSRRRGVELSTQYRPFRWLELNTDVTFARARYRGDLAAFDLDGPFIANAPTRTLSVGALVDGLGPWYGGLQLRGLGPYPINDGDRSPRDGGYTEVNLDVGYKISARLKAQVSIFNAFNSHANASSYYYVSRLPGEPAEGIADYQRHPLEPVSARFSVTATF